MTVSIGTFLLAVVEVKVGLFLRVTHARQQAEAEMERARLDAATHADRVRTHRYHHVCDRCRTEVRSDWMVRRCIACMKPYGEPERVTA